MIWFQQKGGKHETFVSLGRKKHFEHIVGVPKVISLTVFAIFLIYWISGVNPGVSWGLAEYLGVNPGVSIITWG